MYLNKVLYCFTESASNIFVCSGVARGCRDVWTIWLHRMMHTRGDTTELAKIYKISILLNNTIILYHSMHNFIKYYKKVNCIEISVFEISEVIAKRPVDGTGL